MRNTFCRVFCQPLCWPKSRLELIGGVMCEMRLLHIGDFHTYADALKWVRDNPACINDRRDRLEYRILPVAGYYPCYTTQPLEAYHAR